MQFFKKNKSIKLNRISLLELNSSSASAVSGGCKCICGFSLSKSGNTKGNKRNVVVDAGGDIRFSVTDRGVTLSSIEVMKALEAFTRSPDIFETYLNVDNGVKQTAGACKSHCHRQGDNYVSCN